MKLIFKLCWNPVELVKRIVMAFKNARGPALALIENRFIDSPTRGPVIVAHNTQDNTFRVYSLDPGPSPPTWEPSPEVREQVKESLRCLIKPCIRKAKGIRLKHEPEDDWPLIPGRP